MINEYLNMKNTNSIILGLILVAFIFVMILLVKKNIFGIDWFVDYTNIPREDRIEIQGKENDGDSLFQECNFLGSVEQKINLEIIYPNYFDHKELVFEDSCLFQFYDRHKLVLDFGSISNIHAYLLLDTMTHSTRFVFFTDRNEYDANWLLKLGHLTNDKPTEINFTFNKEIVEFASQIHFKRPLYAKDDLNMSNLQGFADYLIYGCSICHYNDSTIDRLIQMELDYLEKHKEAIPDADAFIEQLLLRFNKKTLPK